MLSSSFGFKSRCVTFTLHSATRTVGIRTYEIAFEPQRCGDSKKALLKGTSFAVANFGKILQQCCGLALRAAVALRQPVA